MQCNSRMYRKLLCCGLAVVLLLLFKLKKKKLNQCNCVKMQRPGHFGNHFQGSGSCHQSATGLVPLCCDGCLAELVEVIVQVLSGESSLGLCHRLSRATSFKGLLNSHSFWFRSLPTKSSLCDGSKLCSAGSMLHGWKLGSGAVSFSKVTQHMRGLLFKL